MKAGPCSGGQLNGVLLISVSDTGTTSLVLKTRVHPTQWMLGICMSVGIRWELSVWVCPCACVCVFIWGSIVRLPSGGYNSITSPLIDSLWGGSILEWWPSYVFPIHPLGHWVYVNVMNYRENSYYRSAGDYWFHARWGGGGEVRLGTGGPEGKDRSKSCRMV